MRTLTHFALRDEPFMNMYLLLSLHCRKRGPNKDSLALETDSFDLSFNEVNSFMARLVTLPQGTTL